MEGLLEVKEVKDYSGSREHYIGFYRMNGGPYSSTPVYRTVKEVEDFIGDMVGGTPGMTAKIAKVDLP
jgi:hypothetical protein